MTEKSKKTLYDLLTKFEKSIIESYNFSEVQKKKTDSILEQIRKERKKLKG